MVRALAQGSDIIIFDEPTSSLSLHEKTKLFETIAILKQQGKTIIYITHFLEEVMEMCDKYTVLRDGLFCGSGNVSDVTQKQLSEMIVGRDIDDSPTEKEIKVFSEPFLQVENFNQGNILKNINFTLNRGEILGIWGLMRSGRTELLRAITGLDLVDSGSIYITEDGKKSKIKPANLLKKSGYVTESRHSDGLILDFPIYKNISLTKLNNYKSGGFRFLNVREEKKDAEQLISSLSIRTPNADKNADQLSGGNQQKVILAKWINKNPKIIIMDEPTRGVDVGAKYDIYQIIKDMAKNGCSIILVSSEVEEIVDLCDRIVVMRNGELIAEVAGKEINKINLMQLSVMGG